MGHSVRFAPVAADSLSTLTALASDPPLFPRRSGQKREPVVLYLARVPGSRDVFLTPLKPRTKTVTAEDVESCLYYLHFDSSEDAKLLEEVKSPRHAELNGTLGRKPLPPTPEEFSRSPLSTNTKNFVRRKPIGDPFSAYRDSDPPPLPPRDSDPPPLPSRHGRRSSELSVDFDPTAPTVTLVRRDPSSGTQWNVAKIRDPLENEISSESFQSSPSKATRKSGTPLYIEIFTPGYDKFLQSRLSLDSTANSTPGRYTPDTIPSLEYSTSSAQSARSAAEGGVFRRRMWMEGSHFLGGRSKNVNFTESTRSEEIHRPSGEFRSSGEYSFHSVGSEESPISRDGRLMTKGERRSAVKGYTFLSPWQGRCEFGVGTFGSSLKCRHRLPGVNGSVLPDTVQVSELRFNLPSRSGHQKSSSHSSLAVPSSTSLLSRPKGRKSLSASHIEMDDRWDFDEEHFDLSLGQELAGGGATGKRAKLGKLIIEDEGMKMMDLLVAANMGLWWRAYERAGPEVG